MRYIVYKQDRYNNWIIIPEILSCAPENFNKKRAMNIPWAGLPQHPSIGARFSQIHLSLCLTNRLTLFNVFCYIADTSIMPHQNAISCIDLKLSNPGQRRS